MLSYKVEDMTCGHCVGAITKAIHAVAPAAEVAVYLGRHEVTVGGSADARVVEAAIRDAGYTPVAVEATTPAASPVRSGGCCCGGRAASRCHA